MPAGDLSEIKTLLQMRIGDLCATLLPRGHREGRLWVSHNPVTNDHKGEPALKVALHGDVGAWRDWRGGDKGDVIDLVAYVETGNSRARKEALAWARDWLGIRRMSAADRRAMQARVQKAQVERIASEAKRARERADAVGRLWDSAAPLGTGGAAEARGLAWFEHRRVGLDLVPHLDHATFRFHPDLEWWKGAEYRFEGQRRIKVRPGPRFPAVVAAVRAPTGQVTGVHCTFLDPLGAGKAPVPKARLMFGDVLGAVIRISHGPEGLPPETAVRPELLALGEGIETVASIAIGVPEARAWAAGSLAGVAAAPIAAPFVRAVLLSQENDWTTPQAQRQFADALARLEATGKAVVPMASHFGSDFNDVMQEGDDDGE